MEVNFNIALEKEIKSRYGDQVEVYNPCNNMEINDKSEYADAVMIANADNERLEKTDLLLALLDGPVIDAGLASEIGYFYGMKKPILALYSDSRQGGLTKEKVAALHEVAESQFSYVNLYTIGIIKNRGTVVKTTEELINKIGDYL